MSATKYNILQLEDLKLISKIFTRNWYLYLLIPIILALFAYLYAYRLTNIYEARVQLILKASDNASGTPFKDYYSSYEETSNQMTVIKSSNILEEVIKRLRLNVSYYIVGRLKTTEVYQNMPFVVTSDEFGQNAYGIPFNFKIINDKYYQLNYTFNGKKEEKKYAFGELVVDHDFLFKVDKDKNLNPSFANSFSKINYMFVIGSNNEKIDKYKRNMSIAKEEWTSIVTITLRDEIPERAVCFLDTLSKIYINFSLQNQIETNKNSLEYISKQLDEVVDIINGIEQELEYFKEDKAILNIDREEDAFYTKLVDTEVNLTGIEQKIQSIIDLRKYLIESNDDRFLPPSYYVIKEDEFIRTSIAKLYDFQMNRNENLLEKTEKTFSVTKIDNTIQQTRKNLLTYLSNTETYLKEKQVLLKNELQSFESKLRFIPQKQRQLLNIQRKLEVNERLYTFLLERRAENLITKASILPESKVIEKPRDFGIMYPNRREIITYYIGVGLVIAFIISLIRTLFFDKIKSLEDLNDMTEITIIGGVPYLPKNENYLLADNPRGVITESFRNIRANLQYLFVDKTDACKTLMVTSIFPGEGKTFNSINTAVILAKANKRVIIVDFDMHKPRLHKGFNVEKDHGLSNFLIGGTKLEDVIYETSIENLHAIYSGPVPPNASELVLSKRVKELIDSLKDKYDYIILDTPPLSMISDGLTLINFVDVALFIMNTKHASRAGIRFLQEVTEKNPHVNAAIILNGVKAGSWRYYYGKYSYKYSYGGYNAYGYGYGDRDENA